MPGEADRLRREQSRSIHQLRRRRSRFDRRGDGGQQFRVCDHALVGKQAAIRSPKVAPDADQLAVGERVRSQDVSEFVGDLSERHGTGEEQPQGNRQQDIEKPNPSAGHSNFR